MFDYPIPLRRGGLYEQLGLGPEATAEEINESRQELSGRLRSQQRNVQRDLEAIYGQVPGLRQAWDQLQSMQTGGADIEPARFREVQLKLAGLEEQALRIRSDFKSLRDQAADLEVRIHEANLMAIQNPEDRLEYDRNHPPFELIKLADCSMSPLDNRKSMLTMVRAELSDFFEQSGEDVFHPSDLTRTDFLNDFTRDQNLDRSA